MQQRHTPAASDSQSRTTIHHAVRRHHLPLAAAGRHVTLVIDNTDQPMAIMPVAYSVGGYGPRYDTPALTIPPFSVATSAHDIEYYGHDAHAPPQTLQAGAPQATRYWLISAPP